MDDSQLDELRDVVSPEPAALADLAVICVGSRDDGIDVFHSNTSKG